MTHTLRAGMAGLTLLSFLAFLPSCTRDTGNAERSSTTTTTSGGSTTDTSRSSYNTSMGSNPEMASDNRPLSLTAHLVNKDELASNKAAVVEVNVTGIRLVDPDQSPMSHGTSAGATADSAAGGTMGAVREGHLHYRLDGGPIIATPATRLAFHELAPGQHTITVMLASSNHAPLGPQETLTFTVPS